MYWIKFVIVMEFELVMMLVESLVMEEMKEKDPNTLQKVALVVVIFEFFVSFVAVVALFVLYYLSLKMMDDFAFDEVIFFLMKHCTYLQI